MISRYGRWIADTAVVVALLTGAETVLIYLLTAELTGAFDRAPLSWVHLWIVGLLAFFLPRTLHGSRGPIYPLGIAAAVIAVSLFSIWVACYPSWPLWGAAWVEDAIRALSGEPNAASRNIPTLVVTIFGLWWRQNARETPGSDAAGSVFRWGPVPVAVLCLLGIQVWGARSAEMRSVTGYVAAFFLLCLLALAYARWNETPTRSAGRVTSLLTWMSASMLPVLLALAVTSALSALLFGKVAPVLALLGRGVLTLLVGALVIAVTVAGLLAWAVVLLIRWVFSLFSGTMLPPSPAPGTDESRRQLQELVQRYMEVPPVVLWTGLGLATLLAVYALTRLRPRRESTAGAAVIRESVWEAPDPRAALRSLVKTFTRRLPTRAQDPLAALLADPTWKHTGEVRHAYRDVQASYARAGRGRVGSQTPREHAKAHGAPELAELAAIYGQVRYSTRPASESLARRAKELRDSLVQGRHGDRGRM